MSEIDYQALREAAEKATKGCYIVGHTSGNQHGNITGVFVCQKWKGEPGGVIAECHVNCLVETDVQAYANAEFIAAFNPNVALALLDEREAQNKRIAELKANLVALAAENAGLKHAMAVTLEHVSVTDAGQAGVAAMIINDALHHSETPATDAFLAEIRAEARNEGINYTASRLAAAFNHGFINKSLREVFDVTRMILSAKEELANEPHPIDGLSGEYAEKSLEEWAEQIRKGGNQ
ncbi:ead/Ea22-like family protein [Escherichia coli]|uniref:ead/Ea22-like family protein n=4 Tax=Escherichia coli TaxID=562 RepID=UPI001D2569CC|nr:ead/Ea22-like family protein [Escherichia coli]EEX1991580.1 ead/Ea22-like family protein [Escherichia coli]EEY2933521.1 ead/Ea22-like family protein [Escherichia coli]EGL2285697.1 ead/Ea22-like family protein [Escherichia coli]EHP2517886.1 ead/Ea22-like family protein [Escherichia coli]